MSRLVSRAALAIGLLAVIPWSNAQHQQAYIKASNTDANDQFGWWVSVSGNTLLVVAPYESSGAKGVNGDQSDNSAPAAGAAYVFVRNASSGWGQQAYLKASNTDPIDHFGWAAAIDGDTLAASAADEESSATGVNGDQDDNNAASSGAVYVFVRDGNGEWSQQAYLKASNTDANDSFGWSLALSGDTLVVGTPYEDSNAKGVNGNEADNSASRAGAAYVFVRDLAGNWRQQAYLKASNAEAGDRFGSAVTVSGDTIVVGAPYEDSNAKGINGDQNNGIHGFWSGAAYVFVRDGNGEWSQQAYLKASNTDEDDHFGCSLALSDDTLVVGALHEESSATGVNGDETDNSAPYAGAAYVFFRDSGGIWSQQAYLKASNTGRFDEFGFQVSASDDLVLVGAWGEASDATGVNGDQSNDNAPGAGAAYLFARDAGGMWSQRAYLKASNTDTSGDGFASSVVVSGDTIVIGAQAESGSATGVNGNQHDNSAHWAGAAYAFAGLDCPYAPCDADCDGSVNGFDIVVFVELLTGGGNACSPCAGDANDDGSVNALDVDAFVAILTGNG